MSPTVSRNGDLTLDAGIIQGITIGCTVSVHPSNLLSIPQQPNPSLGALVVTAVDSASATLALQCPIDSGAMPTPLDLGSLHRLFYCRVVERPSESITISSNNTSWLEASFAPEFRASHSIVIVPDTKAADLVFFLEDDTVYIDRISHLWRLILVPAHHTPSHPTTSGFCIRSP